MDATQMRELAKKEKIYVRSGCNFYPFSVSLYQKLFQPNDQVKTVIKEIQSQLGSKEYFSLHVRRTDNKVSISNSPLELFFAHVDQCLAKSAEPRFFLATDSDEVKEIFSRRYGEQVVFNPRKAERGTLSGMIDGVAELWILAQSHLTFGSYWSSYTDAVKLINPGNTLHIITK